MKRKVMLLVRVNGQNAVKEVVVEGETYPELMDQMVQLLDGHDIPDGRYVVRDEEDKEVGHFEIS